jgi:hypothetical protein
VPEIAVVHIGMTMPVMEPTSTWRPVLARDGLGLAGFLVGESIEIRNERKAQFCFLYGTKDRL